MTQYPLCRTLGGPQGWSERVRKISPSPGFDPPAVQPVGSRYTDKAIPAHFIIIIIICIIIIIIIIFFFMQGIYTYIPEKNHVPREYSLAAILLLLFIVLISLLAVLNLLYFYISTFRRMCAVPSMAVFCSSLTSWFPGMLLTYFVNVIIIIIITLLLLLLLLLLLFS